MADEFLGIQPIGRGKQGKNSSFYNPVEGLTLKTPSVTSEYQSGNFNTDAYNPDYDSFFEKLLNDTTGKYIGSVPAIGQNPKWKTMQPKTQNVMSQVIGSPVTNQVIGGIDSMVQAGNNMARNEYESDLTYWKEQGKWWFDPDADVRPDLDSYLDQMPSALESRGVGREVMGIATQTASGAATGAQIGGGWGALIGAGAGGLIGTLQTVFGRSSARKEDKKNEARATLAYERALKEWTTRRNRRQRAQTEARYEKQKAEREAKKNEKKTDSIIKAQNAGTRRQQIANAIMAAGSTSAAHRNKRMERWAA